LRDKRDKLSDACKREEMLMEQREVSNIELSTNLLKTCRVERQLFCRDVRPGSARVFRCLAENMADADFGGGCKDQIIAKLQRRQANWKLDPPLRKACRQDVAEHCKEMDAQQSEKGLVYKCLIEAFGVLTTGCQRVCWLGHLAARRCWV
jgi:golgi apparatus protein 1